MIFSVRASCGMLRKVHIEKISRTIALQFASMKGLIATEGVVQGRIVALLTANMDAEHALDDDAHKLLDKNRRAIGGDIDEQKAFAMIKKQLAKQRNFIL